MIPEIVEVRDRIRTFQDPSFEGFTGFPYPPTFNAAAIAWSQVFELLLYDVIPSTTVKEPAKAAFLSVLEAWGEGVYGVPILQEAFQTGATLIATGMTASGFTGVPPPSPPIFTLTGLITRSALIEATNIATVLVIWAKTGTATPIGGGPPINWN